MASSPWALYGGGSGHSFVGVVEVWGGGDVGKGGGERESGCENIVCSLSEGGGCSLVALGI
eukprot:9540877-Alexandrium_andersonii.AAC.1